MNSYLKKYIVLGILITSVISAVAVNRALAVESTPNTLPTTYTLLEPLPCIPSEAAKDSQGRTIPGTAITCAEGEMKTSINFKEYVQYMFNLLIAMAAVSAVFVIVMGGFQYMTSDSYNGKSDGLKKAKNAILGLLLVLSSFLILQTIDPRLVQINETFVPALFDCNGKDANSPFCKRTNLDEIFKSLESQAAQHGAESVKLREEREKLKADATQLQKELDDLYGLAVATGSDLDPEVYEQMSDLQTQINEKTSQAVAANYESQMQLILQYDARNDMQQTSGIWDTIMNSQKYKKMYIEQLNVAKTKIGISAEEGKKKLLSVSNPASTAATARIEDARKKAIASIDEKLATFTKK
jgi:hypothetical protein